MEFCWQIWHFRSITQRLTFDFFSKCWARVGFSNTYSTKFQTATVSVSIPNCGKSGLLSCWNKENHTRFQRQHHIHRGYYFFMLFDVQCPMPHVSFEFSSKLHCYFRSRKPIKISSVDGNMCCTLLYTFAVHFYCSLLLYTFAVHFCGIRCSVFQLQNWRCFSIRIREVKQVTRALKTIFSLLSITNGRWTTCSWHSTISTQLLLKVLHIVVIATPQTFFNPPLTIIFATWRVKLFLWRTLLLSAFLEENSEISHSSFWAFNTIPLRK